MRNTSPERLSPDEMQIAGRVCFCVFCNSYWVRRKTQIPDRCPKCHKKGWDRPFINALLAALPSTTNPPPDARKNDDTSGGLK
jgi:hypothetical protein